MNDDGDDGYDEMMMLMTLMMLMKVMNDGCRVESRESRVSNLKSHSYLNLRFSTTVCLAMVLAMIMELQYKTESESEQEDEITDLVDQLVSHGSVEVCVAEHAGLHVHSVTQHLTYQGFTVSGTVQKTK